MSSFKFDKQIDNEMLEQFASQVKYLNSNEISNLERAFNGGNSADYYSGLSSGYASLVPILESKNSRIVADYIKKFLAFISGKRRKMQQTGKNVNTGNLSDKSFSMDPICSPGQIRQFASQVNGIPEQVISDLETIFSFEQNDDFYLGQIGSCQTTLSLLQNMERNPAAFQQIGLIMAFISNRMITERRVQHLLN